MFCTKCLFVLNKSLFSFLAGEMGIILWNSHKNTLTHTHREIHSAHLGEFWAHRVDWRCYQANDFNKFTIRYYKIVYFPFLQWVYFTMLLWMIFCFLLVCSFARLLVCNNTNREKKEIWNNSYEYVIEVKWDSDAYAPFCRCIFLYFRVCVFLCTFYNNDCVVHTVAQKITREKTYICILLFGCFSIEKWE